MAPVNSRDFTRPMGVNHIYVNNQHDLFLHKVIVQQKDRLFQFEVWRRQATGTLAEILARGELKRYRCTPLCLPWRHANRTSALSPAGCGYHNAYGWCQCLHQLRACNPTPPEEFTLLKYSRASGQPEVVISPPPGITWQCNRRT